MNLPQALAQSLAQRLTRISAILVKELRQLSRDGPTFAMVVMIPLIQLLMFGYAINTDLRDLPVTVVDYSNNTDSRHLIAALGATQMVMVARRDATPQAAEAALLRGDVRAALIIPVDFSQRLADQRSVAQWLVDGSDTLVSASLQRLADMPLTALDARAVTRDQRMFEVALYYNPERRAAVNTVPGLAAVILTMTMIMFTSAALVREREQGHLELLIATPVQPLELMIGKIVPYIFVGLIQVAIILGLGKVIFSVPVVGSLLQVLWATLLFIVASLTLGLIISTLAKTQLQAMQMTIFVLLPSILLSGFMFPYEGMPRAAQWLAETLPATHYMRLMRGVVLRGAEMGDLLGDVLWLLVFAGAGLLVAAKRFKKRLD